MADTGPLPTDAVHSDAAGADAVPRRAVPRLQLITDRWRCGGRPLVEVVAEAARGGLGAVQLREKDLADEQLLDEARRLCPALGDVPLLINGRVAVALAVGAAGVHLPENAPPVAVARRLLGPEALIGRSVRDLAAARAAEADGVDYIFLGTIFATSSKPGRAAAGLPLVETVARAVRVPVIAIGGIDERNVAAVIGAGAWGVAISSAILGAPAPAIAVERLSAIIGREVAWR